MDTRLAYFEDEAAPALRLAEAAGLKASVIKRHDFPDQELMLTLVPPLADALPRTLVVYRSLDRPNDKLVELLLVARHARRLGVKRLVLVAPYLAYMRQDIAFHPGEIVSQPLVGGFLDELYDALITVDPHLHRISRLEEVMPRIQALTLSGAPTLADLIQKKRSNPLLLGPDAESSQWIEMAAAATGLDHGVCHKVRHGDTRVEIALPDLDLCGREVVLMDDIASSGHTLACAIEAVLAAGADSVDVAVTHALFAGDALEVIRQAGVNEVWSTDCIAHPSNAVAMAPILGKALGEVLADTQRDT
ncbi:ribose-phosphate diphosphokinase [Halomonas sp. I5-271120]|uniref:ribose-phosphate diphosphokinase n=1 Tax=Halomonas sp. I5-271120 TaxID=3061632 RepID=UPI0027153CFB|nr:ribose-phosphate diphosphokinase [Halomonas sp. I5-271120]